MNLDKYFGTFQNPDKLTKYLGTLQSSNWESKKTGIVFKLEELQGDVEFLLAIHCFGISRKVTWWPPTWVGAEHKDGKFVCLRWWNTGPKFHSFDWRWFMKS